MSGSNPTAREVPPAGRFPSARPFPITTDQETEMLSDDLWEFQNLVLSRLADPLFNFPEHRDHLYALASLVDAIRLTMDASPGLPPGAEAARLQLLRRLHEVVTAEIASARLEFVRAIEYARAAHPYRSGPHPDTDPSGDSGG